MELVRWITIAASIKAESSFQVVNKWPIVESTKMNASTNLSCIEGKSRILVMAPFHRAIKHIPPLYRRIDVISSPKEASSLFMTMLRGFKTD